MAKEFEPFTVEKILKWADQYHEWTGRWPTTRHDHVLGREDISWEAVNDALRKGTRGMPGGTTLHRLLAKHRGILDSRRIRPDLTRKQIIEWIREHHQRTGEWPMRDAGAVHSAPDITWSTVASTLKRGGTQLPGGETLKQLLFREFGIWSTLGNRPLTIPLILKWADQHRDRTGKWPIVMSGKVHGQGRETWAALNEALKHGRRGLPGGSSVAKLLIEHRGAAYKPTVATFTEKQIVAWAREYYTKHRRWPTMKSGRCGPARLSWALIDRALRKGEQGLPGGSSLARLLAESRGEKPRGPGPRSARQTKSPPSPSQPSQRSRKRSPRHKQQPPKETPAALPWTQSPKNEFSWVV